MKRNAHEKPRQSSQTVKVKIPSKPCWDFDALFDWVIHSGRKIVEQDRFTQALADKLVAVGAPLDGLRVMLRTLNPQVLAMASFWSSTDGQTHSFLRNHDILKTDAYIGSPLEIILEERRSLHQPLNALPDNPHSAYTELLEQGYTDYFGLPVVLSDDSVTSIIFSTKQENGFESADIEAFTFLRDLLAPMLELQATRHAAISLMNTYVGKRTGKKILDGMVHRGDADVINAAIWFSDLRNFTRFTENLPSEQLLEMLNTYFEQIASAVTARGGEILRFIGDAMLIVFPIDDGQSDQSAANSAIDAAIDAQTSLAALNHQRKEQGKQPIEFGVGLNIGEVVYGNVGAPDRLDFTVMGPAVNRAARLESLTKTLGGNILFSKEFSELIEHPVEDLGEHEMKGIEHPQSVFALRD